MGTLEFRLTPIRAAVAVALCALPQISSAAGFSLTEQNASGLGNSYAGAAAVAEDASTIFFNPAGMTRLSGRQVVGALSLVNLGAKFSDSGASTVPSFQTPGGGNGGDAGSLNAVPAAYLSWELSPGKWWLGIGVNAPFGLSTKWDSGWVGRFHAVESSVQAIAISPSIAWKVNDQFSVGAGVSAVHMSATFTNSTPYSLVAYKYGALSSVGMYKEGEAKIEGDSWAWGWNAGATWQVAPATRLGITYRSHVSQDLGGNVTFSDRPAALGGALPDGPVSTKVKLPDSASLAIAHDVDARWQLLADYTWTGWSSIQQLVIARDTGQTVSSVELGFKDTWRLGLGANYRMNEAWTLRLGVAYESTPAKDDKRTPRLPDSSRVWTSIGAQWRASPQTAVDFGFAYEWIDKGSSDLHSASAGNLVGEYKLNVWILGAQVRYSF